jgi:nucleoside-diphosphate-sugar epimerase
VVATGDLVSFRNWSSILTGMTAVVHLVARTHNTGEHGLDSLAAYRAVNVDVTRRLAAAALESGVTRFVYLSSIKAVGNASRQALCEEQPCCPVDSYGRTKLEAEQSTWNMCRNTSCQATILRPPLVYGPGVGGNFLRLLELVRRGTPLPAICNLRSFLHVDNLADAITKCLRHEAARGEVFHVADGEPISTAQLIGAMAAGLGRRPRLAPAPGFVVNLAGRLLGRIEETRRLTESLIVSTNKIADRLSWRASRRSLEGVEETSREFAREPWHVASGSSEKSCVRYFTPPRLSISESVGAGRAAQTSGGARS